MHTLRYGERINHREVEKPRKRPGFSGANAFAPVISKKKHQKIKLAFKATDLGRRCWRLFRGMAASTRPQRPNFESYGKGALRLTSAAGRVFGNFCNSACGAD
jgi:hypothetical protein